LADFEWLEEKLAPGAERVLEIAIQESKRRGQFFLGVEHLFLGLIEADRDGFRQLIGGYGISFNRIRSALERELSILYRRDWEGIRVTPRAERIFHIALEQAKADGREQIEPPDLLQAIFQEGQSIPVRILQENGISRETLLSRTQRAGWVAEGVLTLPPLLQECCYDLTSLAEAGKLPIIVGREKEIKQMIEVLLIPEGPANPLLIGEAGVGKTAIVEGLAQKLVSKDGAVPERLRRCRIICLQMNSVVAGTMLRGSFEWKMQQIISFFSQHKDRAILFIDELHTIVGAGSAMGVPTDAAEILLSALGRGEIRLIGTTTPSKYKELIRSNEALDRRFTQIKVGEPPLETVRVVLQSVKQRLEKQRGLQISEEAIARAIELAPRYLRSRKLPDKAKQWLVQAVTKAEFEKRKEVTAQDVIMVVSEQTGIPEDVIVRNSLGRLERMEEVLKEQVIGQDEAIGALARRVRTKLSPLKENPVAPNGVFLFLGPTGVGKTKTAEALAEFLFADESRMVRFDMSEYQDPDAMSRLIGRGRGIVGAERGGLLTERIKEKPYTVLLLDEIEKAHPQVLNLFLQAFDEGWITDGLGDTVYFSDVIIIMTSNLGSHLFRKLLNPMGFLPEREELSREQLERVHQELIATIKRENWMTPEFLNRIDLILVFDPLSKETVKKIVRLLIDRLNERIAPFGKRLVVDEAAVELIVERGYSVEFGARELKRVLAELVEDQLALHWEEASDFETRVVEGKLVVVPLTRAVEGEVEWRASA
jgi:ATP-dependent Clp protease ATP-binding subunit ClpA